MITLAESREQFAQAVTRLEDVLQQPKNEYIRDSAVQRFEFTFDLAWKTLKVYIEDHLKVRCASPRSCFREAYVQGLIEYEKKWLDMATDRNNTAHMYKESVAEAVYSRLPDYLKLFQELLGQLERGAKESGKEK